MQVENIECQIASAQIGNYLAGAGLSEEALVQLEAHLGECDRCTAVLEERRAELLSMLEAESQPVPAHFVEPEPGPAKTIGAALRRKSLEMMQAHGNVPTQKAATAAVHIEKAEAAAKPVNYWKPLLYSVGLASVLVGMSLFSKNLSSAFGSKAADALPITTNSTTVAGPTNTPPVAPAVTQPAAPANPDSAKAPGDASTTTFGTTPGPTTPTSVGSAAGAPKITTTGTTSSPKPGTTIPAGDIAKVQTPAKKAEKKETPKPAPTSGPTKLALKPTSVGAAKSSQSIAHIQPKIGIRPRKAHRHKATRRPHKSAGVKLYDPNGNPL